MTLVQDMGAFVAGSRPGDLSVEVRRELKLRVLDSLGCAIGALSSDVAGMIRKHVEDFGGNPRCTLIGGGATAPDLAAFYNGALVRYLDFNDSYLAPKETCHPSDNVGAVLAAAESTGAGGEDFLAALAVSYQVQCRLSDVAPVRDRGFDHTTQGAYAVAAGVARALRLDAARTAHAMAISGTALNALRVTRTGSLSHWKGLAYPNTAFGATHAAFLAMRGVTGPLEVFEGNKGFMDAISGPFEIDWSKERLDAVPRTIIKKYNAEIHSQSTLEAVLELRRAHEIFPQAVERIEVDTFDVAYDIIGGGEEGAKNDVRTKEQADHSLPYLIAVALVDGEVLPHQYRRERIAGDDAQALLRKVVVRPDKEYSRRFPSEMPCRVTIHMSDGSTFTGEARDYEGFHSRPAKRETILEKFRRLAVPFAGEDLSTAIANAVDSIEGGPITELAALLGRIEAPGTVRRERSI